jgi:hypothetical protein
MSLRKAVAGKTVIGNISKIKVRRGDVATEFNPHAFEFNGSLVVSIDAEIVDQSKILACCNDEIRSICEILDYTNIFGRKYYALMVYSNENVEGDFRLYYKENDDSELISIDYTFAFEADMISGDFINPVMITLPITDNDEIIEYSNKISVYPNPFNPIVNIQFELAEGSNVLIEVYNMKGQKVTTLINAPYEAGKYSTFWEAANQSSCVYLLRYETEGRSELRKIILLK